MSGGQRPRCQERAGSQVKLFMTLGKPKSGVVRAADDGHEAETLEKEINQ